MANLEVKRVPKRNLYVGCGPDIRENYLHCDIREFPHVDFVCKAWEVSQHTANLSQIYSRHMLEHLTAAEVFATLHDWYEALAKEGSIYLVVPNIDFHIQQWLNAEWNDSELNNPRSLASHAFSGFYGWQRECDPTQDDYNQSYWDVHKSAYNKKRMQYVLEKIGFRQIELEIKSGIHLVAKAIK